MRLGRSFRLVTLCSSAALLLLASPLSAQQQEPPTRDRNEERRAAALERLRRMGAAGAPDTLPADTSSAEGEGVGEGPALESGDTIPPLAEADSAGADSAAIEAPPPLPQWTGDAETDSVLAALRQLDGYTPMEYRGKGAHFDGATGRLVLGGEAMIERDGQSMTADSSLVYERNTAVVCGYGQPVMSGEGNAPVSSDQVCYDVNRQVGNALGARTTFQESAEWYIHGEDVRTQGSERLYGHHTNFTACDLEVPHYHFGAKDVKVVHGSVMVARNVTLQFEDVPVFWLPFMVQSLKQGRRSGLLTPTIGLNDIARTSSNYERNIDNLGFYWAINDYMDGQVALSWYSNNYTGLRGGLAFRWAEKFLSGNFNFTRFWPSGGGSQFTLTGNGNWEPFERTSVRVSANWASSSRFVRDNSYDPLELNRSIKSDLSLNHRFRSGASLSIGGSRQQQLQSDQVDLQLPGMRLTLPPITLFSASPENASWYNNITWNGNGGFDLRTRRFGEPDANSQGRGRTQLTGNLGSSFRVGNLSWSQSADFNEETLQARPGVDSLNIRELSRDITQRIGWNSSLSYLIPLFGTTSITPRISASGQVLKSDSTSGEHLLSPTRVSMGAGLKVDLFGFWPGVGPYERFRHRLSPSLSYEYAPRVSPTAEQRDVFGDNIRERNAVTLTLDQTFEARQRSQEGEAGEAEAEAEGEAEPESESPAGGGPRRLERAPTTTLLSLRTSAVAYDFVSAREENIGFTTTQLTNTIRSDLVQSLQLTVAHDLFRTEGAGPCVETGVAYCLEFDPPPPTSRSFAPHLSRIDASFEIDGNHWLFRTLGLGGSQEEAEPDSTTEEEDVVAQGDDPFFDQRQPRAGQLMPGLRDDSRGFGPRGGPWTASLTYRLSRPRPTTGSSDSSLGDQSIRGNIRFQPTEKWSVNWNTDYSIKRREFGHHYLTLSRDLHDWDATFSFVKAQNGNFSFMFNISLRANPDLKFDYNQRDRTQF